MKLRKVSDKLYNLAKKVYKNRDKSHGIYHATKVKDNAMIICNKLNITDINMLLKIEAAALLHDAWDHKYIKPNTMKHHEIKTYVYNKLISFYFSDHDIKDIEIIIDNISLSLEMNNNNNNIYIDLKHLQLMRDIVSDADKLEMLGLNGIDRIIEYQLYKYPNTEVCKLKYIIKDIYDYKISKLIDDNYIRTKPGKELAIPLLNEMNNYIKLNKYIYL